MELNHLARCENKNALAGVPKFDFYLLTLAESGQQIVAVENFYCRIREHAMRQSYKNSRSESELNFSVRINTLYTGNNIILLFNRVFALILSHISLHRVELCPRCSPSSTIPGSNRNTVGDRSLRAKKSVLIRAPIPRSLSSDSHHELSKSHAVKLA